MERLAIHLAVHGVAVLIVSIVGGGLLYRAILEGTNQSQWHLLHAGGTARGILLIALAGIIHLPALPGGQLATMAWLMIAFVWTSTLAMLIAAASGDRGLNFGGSMANRLVWALYAVGTVALAPALVLLVYGLLTALRLSA